MKLTIKMLGLIGISIKTSFIAIIFLILFTHTTFGYARDYIDPYEEDGYYIEEQYDFRDYEEGYDDRDYYEYEQSYNNSEIILKNGDSCFSKKKGYELYDGCYYNGYCYGKPTNSKCINDKYNAWKCNKGYIEKNGACDYNNCKIKGNLAYKTKEKVYYLPEYGRYNEVEINTKFGEKWFCSEKDAINAGFVKSYRCLNLNNNPNNNNSYTGVISKSNKKKENDYSWIWIIVIIGGIIIITKK